MDTAMLMQRSMPPLPDQRHRVGSVSSSGSQAILDEQRSPAPDSVGYPSIASGRHPEPPTPSTPSKSREKKSSGKRLLKRQVSRPASPVVSIVASVDSLPTPVSTSEPTRIISLMRALGGRMRGEIEYQGDVGGSWNSGYAYIDDDKGYLMCDSGQNSGGSFFTTLISDLRGCRVLPVEYPEAGKACLELVTADQKAAGENNTAHAAPGLGRLELVARRAAVLAASSACGSEDGQR